MLAAITEQSSAVLTTDPAGQIDNTVATARRPGFSLRTKLWISPILACLRFIIYVPGGEISTWWVRDAPRS